VASERLQVVLARFGIASRRGVVSLIESGQVLVNGKAVLEKGFRVDALKDKITVEGTELPTEQSLEAVYYLFNKPKGVMTTLQDPHAERIVADYFQEVTTRLFPVGRLDRDTTGLLLMTNDGELAFRLTHPKFGVEKKYHVKVKGFVTDEEALKLEKGVALEEGSTAPCVVNVDTRSKRESTLTVILHEGKKRQIRRIFESVSHRVMELERFQYGPLLLGDMRAGQKRHLTASEVLSLKVITGLAPTKKRE
jgi:23S rRNA pseudouridine2605 synthase